MIVDNANNSYQDLLAKLADCFGELGVLPPEHRTTLKDDGLPVVMPLRKDVLASNDFCLAFNLIQKFFRSKLFI